MDLADGSGLVHLSDLHFTSSHRTLDSGYLIDSQNSRLKSAVLSKYLIDRKPSLGSSAIVITGDLTDSGDEEDYRIASGFVAALQGQGFSVFPIPGNHDYCKEGTLWFESQSSAAERRDRFRKYLADVRYPCVVPRAFGILVLLDSMQGELDDWAHADSWAQGRLGPDQLARLKALVDGYQADRAGGKKIVVALHHSPLHNPQNDARGGLDDAQDFLEVVRDKVDVLLFGHTTPDGLLQQGFPVEEAQLEIPVLNCENLEHGAFSPETPVGGFAHWLTVGPGPAGRPAIFYLAPDSRVYCNTRSPTDGSWLGEQRLGDQASQLCVAENQDGTLAVAYLGADGNVYAVKQARPGGPWEAPTPLDGGHWLGEPSGAIPDTARLMDAGRNADGCLELFFIGEGLNVYRCRQSAPSGPWGTCAKVAGPSIDLALAKNADLRLELFSVGLDRNIYHQWPSTPGGDLGALEPLGGQAETLCAVQAPSGELEIVYVGTNGNLYRNRRGQDGRWGGERALGGSARQAALIQNLDGRIELIYVGTNVSLYHNRQDGPDDSWAGEETLRGLFASARQLGAGRNADGRLDLFYVGMNFRIYHIEQTLPNDAYPLTVVDVASLSREVQLVASSL